MLCTRLLREPHELQGIRIRDMPAKKNGKNGKNGKGMDVEDDKAAYDESVAVESEEDPENSAGLSDNEMTNLMGELETLFKEIDWDALADNEKEEEDPSGGTDYSDDLDDRSAEEGNGEEEVGAPDTENLP